MKERDESTQSEVQKSFEINTQKEKDLDLAQNPLPTVDQLFSSENKKLAKKNENIRHREDAILLTNDNMPRHIRKPVGVEVNTKNSDDLPMIERIGLSRDFLDACGGLMEDKGKASPFFAAVKTSLATLMNSEGDDYIKSRCLERLKKKRINF